MKKFDAGAGRAGQCAPYTIKSLQKGLNSIFKRVKRVFILCMEVTKYINFCKMYWDEGEKVALFGTRTHFLEGSFRSGPGDSGIVSNTTVAWL